MYVFMYEYLCIHGCTVCMCSCTCQVHVYICLCTVHILMCPLMYMYMCILMYVQVLVCACVHSCMCAFVLMWGVHMCICIYGGQSWISGVQLLSCCRNFWDRVSLSLELTHRQAGMQDPDILPPSSAQAWALGIWTQIFILCNWAISSGSSF